MLKIQRRLSDPGAFTAARVRRRLRIAALAPLCIAPLAGAQLSDIQPGSPLPDARLTLHYSVKFTPVNPFQGLPVFWNITPGCLDGTGLTFTPDGGLADTAKISGVPKTRGTFNCTVVAQDAAENVVRKAYELTIKRCNSPLIVSAPPTPVAPGIPFTYAVVVTGSGPQTFAALGLPPGLAIDPVTGVIAGTTDASGAYPVTIIVKGCGRAVIQNFTLVVGKAPVGLALSSAPNPAVFGQDIAVSVHATASGSAPTGTVLLCVIVTGQFCAAPVGAPPAGTVLSLIPPLHSATLDAAGNASFTVSGLAIQNYTMQAYYGGDATHDGARSTSLDQFVIKGVVFPPARSSRNAAAATAGAAAEPIPALSLPMLGVLAIAVIGITVARARRRG